MNLIKKHLNKIIIGIALVFISTFGYNYISDQSGGNSALDEKIISESMNEEAGEIIKTLNELGKITIDASFFTEDLAIGNSNLVSFVDLVDFTQTKIPNKMVGKVNPFVFNNISGNNQNIPKKTETETETEIETGDGGEIVI
ncbi:MAG: hypothetical protein KAI16_01025 [Candidatus Pacebacteria bacterium]|nr:hypothetical protein [Candidatus Paceibacterota bacterium]